VEDGFLALLERLRPEAAYIRLFKAIVIDAWRKEETRTRDLEHLRTKRVGELRQRIERLEEAFIYERSIDPAVYQRQRDRLNEELALAELALHDVRMEGMDVEGVLGFAEHLMKNAAGVWHEASLPQ
jgi:hypothetical protein